MIMCKTQWLLEVIINITCNRLSMKETKKPFTQQLEKNKQTKRTEVYENIVVNK